MKHLNIGLYVRNSHLVDSALGKACHDLSGAQATVGLWMWRVGTQLSARFESIWVQGHAILQDDPWPTLPTSTVSFVIIPRWCIIHFWSLTINQRRCGTAVEKCDGILEGFEVMISWKAFFFPMIPMVPRWRDANAETEKIIHETPRISGIEWATRATNVDSHNTSASFSWLSWVRCIQPLLVGPSFLKSWVHPRSTN